MIIDGREIAKKILDELKTKVQTLNLTPHLAIILVGNDPASLAYVNQKKIKAKQIGAKTTIVNLESRIQSSELKELIDKLNKDDSVHGIIVQQPLPPQINLKKITQAIDPQKDVDGFHPNSKFQPPIAAAVLKILEDVFTRLHLGQGVTLTNWFRAKEIAVIGKGKTGGKPIIEMFEKMGINPRVIDSKTKNPEQLTKNVGIIISAVGKPNVIKAEMIKSGCILISIGLSKGKDGKLHGDYDEEKIKNIASFYTPTPGGVGPLNVAMLLKNLLIACQNFSR